MIITDLGEECDDEVACLLANEVAEKGVKVTLVFTNEAAQAAFLTLKPIHSDNLKMLNISDSLADIFKDGETNTLLQIGPVHHRTSLDIGSYPYNYFLLGTLGVTLNSQPKGAGAKPLRNLTTRLAASLFNAAENRTVVDTMAGKGAFKFTYDALVRVFYKTHPIIPHVIKIGWRNTVGRASPSAGRFIAHLVRAPANPNDHADELAKDAGANYELAKDAGANYETVKAIVDVLENAKIKRKQDHCNKKIGQYEVESGKAAAVAAIYLENLKTLSPAAWGLRLDVDLKGVITNSRAGTWKASRVVDGYTYILENLKKYFDVPIEFFESGKPEDWKKQWLYPSLADSNKVSKADRFQTQ